MSRTIPAPLLASTTAAQLNPFFATSLDFDDGTVRYWTGYGTITIGSVTYAGLGAFSSISTIEETEDLSARGLTIDLTGVPNDLVSRFGMGPVALVGSKRYQRIVHVNQRHYSCR